MGRDPRRIVSLAIVAVSVAGCGGSSPGGRGPARAAATAGASPATASPSPAAIVHHHEHAAPHGGTLVELGEEAAHVEIVFDRKAGRLVAYLLDGEAEASVRSRQPEIAARVERLDVSGRPLVGVAPLDLALLAVGDPLTGESPGDTSRFEGAHEELAGLARLRGVLDRVEVKGRSFERTAFEIEP